MKAGNLLTGTESASGFGRIRRSFLGVDEKNARQKNGDRGKQWI
ncbi:MAG: hypothetical protein WDN00_07835 [Limisphaerales bacterium]